MGKHKKFIIVLSILSALSLVHILNITHLKIDKADIEYIEVCSVVGNHTLKKDDEIRDMIKTLEAFDFARYGNIDYYNGYREATSVSIHYVDGKILRIVVGPRQVSYKGKDYKQSVFSLTIMHEEICEVLVKHGFIQSVWG